MPLEQAFAFMRGSRSPSTVRPDALGPALKDLERIHRVNKNARKLREEQKASNSGKYAYPTKSR
eukprot:7255184-Pyramimonas_sp.AAC.1